MAVQATVAHPMLPLHLFRSHTVTAAALIGFAFMVGYYGMPFVMSLFLPQERDLSPLDTGVAFVPMMLVGLVLTTLVPRVVERVGARAVVVTGLVLMTVGLAAVALVPPRAGCSTPAASSAARSRSRFFGALLGAPSGIAAGMRVSLLIASAVTAAAVFVGVAGIRTRH